MYNYYCFSTHCFDIIDSLNVLYQSPSKVQLNGTDAIPIFCLASGHGFDHQYKWSMGDESIPGNAPVLWITSPGSYRCDVTSG